MKNLFFIAALSVTFALLSSEESDSLNECPICFNKITEQPYDEEHKATRTHVTCCHTNAIHPECLEDCLTQCNNSCPLCRDGTIVPAQMLHHPDATCDATTALKRYMTRSGKLSMWRTREFAANNVIIRWSPFSSSVLTAFVDSRQTCRLDQKNFSGWVETIRHNPELSQRTHAHLVAGNLPIQAAVFAALQQSFPWSTTFQKALNNLPAEAAAAKLYPHFTKAFEQTGVHAKTWGKRLEVVYMSDVRREVFNTSRYARCLAQVESLNTVFARYHYR